MGGDGGGRKERKKKEVRGQMRSMMVKRGKIPSPPGTALWACVGLASIAGWDVSCLLEYELVSRRSYTFAP